MRVLLVGMMGSGKSSVGRRLAERTGWPFYDNDALVERASGRTARQLLAESGEAALREAEARALEAAVAVEPPAIVGVAAGTILDPVARDRLRGGGLVVWLDAPASVLAQRASGAEHRPWLDRDPRAWFEQAAAERDALYGAVADLTVDTSRGSPAQAADAIRDALEARETA